MATIELNYYKTVVQTQTDPEILSAELQDLISEIEDLNSSKRSVQPMVRLLNSLNEIWPKCPYPEDIFTMTIKEYVKAVPDKSLRTAISGCMARFGWEIASRQICDSIKMFLKDNEE